MPAPAGEPPSHPRIRYLERFLREYAKAPCAVQEAFDKQVTLLLENPRHPSLQSRKYESCEFVPVRQIWYARATRAWRFYFTTVGDTYWFLSIRPHPK